MSTIKHSTVQSDQTKTSASQEKRKLVPAVKSRELAEEIERLIPGGVNSPFRSFEEVGGHTIFFERGEGAYLFDIDGNRYIDFLGAWGPAILGHSPHAVVEACKKIIELGPVFGSPHTLELEFARKLNKAVPSLEMVRLVNSGTEAVMSAVRLARGFTGKDVIVMAEGGYHGHSDSVLASNGHRTSGGIPGATAGNTVLVQFNALDSLRDCLKRHADSVAAVLLEPVPGSMGVIAPAPGYLEGVRKLCDEFGCLFILDEVLTGFRLALGGAQEVYGVTADLTCYGKGLGGGMPIGAFGGSQTIMKHLQPIGDVYQAGTFSGNPVTMAGGCAMLDLLSAPGVYETLEARTSQLFSAVQADIDKHGYPVQLQRVGSMIAIVFSAAPVRNFQDSKGIDGKQFAKFFHFLLERGVYLPPSSVDAACVSAAHTAEDINEAVDVINQGLNFVFD
jgi:glutamate-1-semialdehyde 2,1-aminomutase